MGGLRLMKFFREDWYPALICLKRNQDGSIFNPYTTYLSRWFRYESETNQQPIRFNFDVEFCRPVLPYNQILWLHHLKLISLYFQSLQSLPNLILLHTWGISPKCALHFNEQITRIHILLLQPSIRPVPAEVTSKYFTVERAAKTLHRMSTYIPVSVPAKIIWIVSSFEQSWCLP